MFEKLRAVLRPSGTEVAACDAHLAVAMRQVTSPVDGHDNDTHVVVRRLGSEHAQTVLCTTDFKHHAAWVLIPQAVLR